MRGSPCWISAKRIINLKGFIMIKKASKKKVTTKKKSTKNKKLINAVILNDKFEFMEVGPSNVLISPKGLEFYAVDRDFWKFLNLFEYGAEFNYVMSAIEDFSGKSKVYKKEYKEIFNKLESASALIKSKKFIHPRIDSKYCTTKPEFQKYDRKWIEKHHPELLVSVNFSDTWGPSDMGTNPSDD